MRLGSNERRNLIYILLLSILTVTLFLVSVCVGKYSIRLSEILSLITSPGTGETSWTVMFMLRVPRTVMALLGGMAFGIAGYIYQIIFKNPLASPDIIGVASGANLGSAIMIVTGAAAGSAASGIGSFIGACAAVLLVLLLSERSRSHSTSTYVLSGIVINSFR